MKKILILSLFQIIICASCCRKLPQVITQEKIVTHIDTVVVQSLKIDTIPCADFSYQMLNEFRDTVYIKVIDKQISVKYFKHSDTVYKETIIIQPAPLRSVIKIDNSTKNKAKNGSAIGDGNTITTKKYSWWWIFLAGALSWFITQNILFRSLKTYFPILEFLP